jgi:hypothetical protein
MKINSISNQLGSASSVQAKNVSRMACENNTTAVRAAKKAKTDSAILNKPATSTNQEINMGEMQAPSLLTQHNLQELDSHTFNDVRVPPHNRDRGNCDSLPSTLNLDLSELLWRKQVYYDGTEPGHKPDDHQEL